MEHMNFPLYRLLKMTMPSATYPEETDVNNRKLILIGKMFQKEQNHSCEKF